MSQHPHTSVEPVETYRERHAAFLMKSLAPPLLVLERGQGARVWDVDGTEYLDFLAGIAVNSLGHAHPVFVEAVSRQAAMLAHVSNYFATPPQLELAERLVRLTGGSRVVFQNSGAEAIEAAIKLARLHGSSSRGPGGHRILSLEGAFHGRTMGATSLSGKVAHRAPFEPVLPGTEAIPVSVDALARALAAGGVSAVVIEPIQGEAGVVDLPVGFLAAARRLTTEAGALLIIDEIQTGAGRTGDWFAFQGAGQLDPGTLPDAVAVAKGIGGGFPIGALIAFGEAAELLQPGHHGSTFGGNPLATATANAVLGEIERAGLVANAAVRGRQLRDRIGAIGSPLVTDVQGRGLLLGVGLARPVASAVVAEAQRRGLIVNAASDSRIRLAPPLIIGDEEVDAFARIFADSLAAVVSESLAESVSDPASDRAVPSTSGAPS